MLKSLVGFLGKAKMSVSSGTQTSVMYPKSMGGYVIDVLEKLNEIKGVFGSIKNEISVGQACVEEREVRSSEELLLISSLPMAYAL